MGYIISGTYAITNLYNGDTNRPFLIWILQYDSHILTVNNV